MRRIFKTRYFSRWMRKTNLVDEALCAAVSEMDMGLIDADLGGGVFKKRVACLVALTLTKPDPLLLKIIDPANAQLFF